MEQEGIKIIYRDIDPRIQFEDAIEEQGRIKTWVAKKVGVTVGHLNNILKQRSPLTQDMRDKLNNLLSTNI